MTAAIIIMVVKSKLKATIAASTASSDDGNTGN